MCGCSERDTISSPRKVTHRCLIIYSKGFSLEILGSEQEAASVEGYKFLGRNHRHLPTSIGDYVACRAGNFHSFTNATKCQNGSVTLNL